MFRAIILPTFGVQVAVWGSGMRGSTVDIKGPDAAY